MSNCLWLLLPNIIWLWLYLFQSYWLILFPCFFIGNLDVSRTLYLLWFAAVPIIVLFLKKIPKVYIPTVVINQALSKWFFNTWRIEYSFILLLTFCRFKQIGNFNSFGVGYFIYRTVNCTRNLRVNVGLIRRLFPRAGGDSELALTSTVGRAVLPVPSASHKWIYHGWF
jgi:hypothetical protein